MPSSRSLCPVLVLAALAASSGCARGGGGDEPRGSADAATPRIDGGAMPALDAGGVIPVDGAVTPIDGGGSPIDGAVTPIDGGSTPCAIADECSDGLACNGVERCELGRCAPGTALACDDGVACTTDACTEPGTCAYAPSDALCPAGQTCGATGCTTGGGSCSEAPCRLASPQCGCPSGQACYASGASRMCAPAGSGAEGAPCSSSAGCAAGLGCIDFSTVAGRPAMQCARYCATDAECTGVGSLCIRPLDDGTGGTIAGTRVCSRACDPLRQTGCAPGLTCNFYQESAGAMRVLTDCTGPSGTGGAGAFCTSDAQCEPGSACIANECLFWCDYATEAGCVGFEYCERLSPRVVLGGVEYGVCI